MSAKLIFNPLSESHIKEPYPQYEAMRNNEPVLWHDKMQGWLLTSYIDCVSVLKDNNKVCKR